MKHDTIKSLYCPKCKWAGKNCELLECPECNTSFEMIKVDVELFDGLTQYTDLQFINFRKLMRDVYKEHIRQVNKWGLQTHTLFEWINYTTEENGELAKAISEFTYRNGTRKEIYKEAIQVATLSLKIAEMVIDKKEKDKHDDKRKGDCAVKPPINASNRHDDGCIDANVDKELPECICENKDSGIIVVNVNEGKPNTCGSCKHTDNNLGFVALHCDLLIKIQEKENEEITDGKVRSWKKCAFNPSKYESR